MCVLENVEKPVLFALVACPERVSRRVGRTPPCRIDHRYVWLPSPHCVTYKFRARDNRSRLLCSSQFDHGPWWFCCRGRSSSQRLGGRRSRRLAGHFRKRRRGSGSKAAREFCSGIARDCSLWRHSAHPRSVCWTSRFGTYDCFYGTPSPSAFFPSISCPNKTGGLTETARVTGGRQVG